MRGGKDPANSTGDFRPPGRSFSPTNLPSSDLPPRPPKETSRQAASGAPPDHIRQTYPKSPSARQLRTHHGPRTPSNFPVPPSQRWLFAVMLLSVVAMATYLIRLRERASDRFAAAAAPVPLSVAETRDEPLRLYLANDSDGSLAEKPIRFPLPLDPNARARVALEKLLEEYSAPGSLHPLHSPPGSVEEIYLLPLPGFPGSVSRLAVVDLTSAFVQSHPSGIEPETLTLLSMIATLRANLPNVTEVRFLVEGQAQATLAGHADLSHAYLAAGTEMAPPPEAGPQP